MFGKVAAEVGVGEVDVRRRSVMGGDDQFGFGDLHAAHPAAVVDGFRKMGRYTIAPARSCW